MDRLAQGCRRLAAWLAAGALAACGGGGGSGAESTFSKSYGGPLHDEARVVVESDSGFLLFGTVDGADLGTRPDEAGSFGTPQLGDLWVQQLDRNGNVEIGRGLGLQGAAHAGTTWTAARATADGGTVLVGEQAVLQTLGRPDGPNQLFTGSDVAVTKLDAAGNVAWRVTHDSGAWANYDYLELHGQAPAAADHAQDVWPMADGGYLVAAWSVGHLHDRNNLGFPCDDAELTDLALRTQGQGCRVREGEHIGGDFDYALSLAIFRLNADGSLRWVRRLLDNPFGSGGLDWRSLRALVRSTDDGGVVVARAIDDRSVLVHRLGADGSPRWRTVLAESLQPLDIADGISDLIQTNDPVDGGSDDGYDRDRDDGFALATHRRILKLDVDGSLRWSRSLTLTQGRTDQRSYPEIKALTQVCVFTRPVRCDIVAVGQTLTLPSEARLFVGFAAFLGADGELRTELLGSEGVGWFDEFMAVAEGANGRLRLLGRAVAADGTPLLALGELLFDANGAVFSHLSLGGPRPFDQYSETAELRPGGGVMVRGRRHVELLDDQLGLQVRRDIAGVDGGETLRAATRVLTDRYVLAGLQQDAEGDTGVIALALEVGSAGPRVLWQRRLPVDPGGDVLAIAATPDAGVVLSLSVPGADGEAAAQRRGRLLKLDVDGNLQWLKTLQRPATRLARLRDGDVAALWFSREAGRDHLLRLSPSGETRWEAELPSEGRAGRAMASTVTGGLVLASTDGPTVRVHWLAADGTLERSRSLVLPSSGGAPASIEDLQIREARDLGLVLAMTERNVIAESAGGAVAARGQANLLVLKLNAAGEPLWGHVYGGAFDDGVRDLAVLLDGSLAVAGYSDSLGDRREGWLLKLSPNGLIAETGCQAHLGTVRASAIVATTLAAASSVPVAPTELASPTFVTLGIAGLTLRTPTDLVTARQCLGDVSAGEPGQATPRRRLRVLQVDAGAQPLAAADRGVVTSAPSGISCGTGLDICEGDFAENSIVVLHAEPTGFLGWRTACEAGTGERSLDCAVTLSQARTIEVAFAARSAPPPPPPPPPPGPMFTLEFTVLGRGFVSTDGGIVCTERDSVQTCSRSLPAGTVVNAMAVPDSGLEVVTWSGNTHGDLLCLSFGRSRTVQFTLDRDVRCQVQFGTTSPLPQVLVHVAGGGVVRDLNSLALDCREVGFTRCQAFVAGGTIVTLTATPDPGWRLAGWGGAGCAAGGASPQFSVLVTRDIYCTATFSQIVESLTVVVHNATGGRNVSSSPVGIDCSSDGPRDCSEDFAPGLLVMLRASPQGFQSWQGCDRVVDVNFCHLTLNQPRTVTATFVP